MAIGLSAFVGVVFILCGAAIFAYSCKLKAGIDNEVSACFLLFVGLGVMLVGLFFFGPLFDRFPVASATGMIVLYSAAIIRL